MESEFELGEEDLLSLFGEGTVYDVLNNKMYFFRRKEE